MPAKLNMYFDSKVARCVESAFATTVIMLCYDFERGGVLESARDTRFHNILRKLNIDNVPVSQWDFDELQLAMLDEIKPVSSIEKDLESRKLKGERPWFVMQDKGDMMSSIAFLYNYITFFACKNDDTKDPFYHDVIEVAKENVLDPLSQMDIRNAPEDETNDPCVVIGYLQKKINTVNPFAKVECSNKGNLKITMKHLESTSDGYMMIMRAPYHYGHTVRHIAPSG
jgi:hypothetical protein